MIAIGSMWQHRTRKSRVVIRDFSGAMIEFQVQPVPNNPSRGISVCSMGHWLRFYEEVTV